MITVKRVTLILFSILLPVWTGCAVAAQTRVKGVRLWAAPDHTRVVLDTEGPVDHKVFSLEEPHRLVIDVKEARLGGVLPVPPDSAPFLRSVRSAQRNGKDLRVVLDLKSAVRAKSFLVKPNELYGHRLVVDLMAKEQQETAPKAPAPTRTAPPEQGRDLVIGIDAGHGGEDPGAKGPSGVLEKDVVMQIARRLARRVDAEPGLRAELIRSGDYYIGLRKRIELAREAKADLFVSIHADSFYKDQRVRGSSVYTLSQRGASSEAARWLAEKENQADLVGGIDLDEADPLLASVLLDLSMGATMQSSRQAAESVLRELRRLGKAHKRQVQHAGFLVLKAPDIPSMLVETAFISNPVEEAKLRDSGHQERLARALLSGIRTYFRNYPPPGTWMAQHTPRRHVIARGDTLSTIASQYRVTLPELRATNGLRGDTIRVGQVLTIPES
jgi:N-acetylmuramoyl-L-alanine amidase